jgi:hypothetical protein
MSFWDIIWFIIVSFAFIAYLIVLFRIINDLFRDRDTSGLAKAVWMVCLLLFPFLTAVVYLIARGAGMAERELASAQRLRESQEAYIRSVGAAGAAGPADEIARAKALLDSGAISAEEFERLKAKALA